MRRATKQQKLARVSGLMSANIAKQNNDPLYNKLAKARELVRKIKEQINRKYGQKGSVAARESVSS